MLSAKKKLTLDEGTNEYLSRIIQYPIKAFLA